MLFPRAALMRKSKRRQNANDSAMPRPACGVGKSRQGSASILNAIVWTSGGNGLDSVNVFIITSHKTRRRCCVARDNPLESLMPQCG